LASGKCTKANGPVLNAALPLPSYPLSPMATVPSIAVIATAKEEKIQVDAFKNSV